LTLFRCCLLPLLLTQFLPKLNPPKIMTYRAGAAPRTAEKMRREQPHYAAINHETPAE
jgi:hypothetical protein